MSNTWKIILIILALLILLSIVRIVVLGGVLKAAASNPNFNEPAVNMKPQYSIGSQGPCRKGESWTGSNCI